MSLPDPMCEGPDDPDSDGDGIPDSSDPCPANPNRKCESMTVYGRQPDPNKVTCSDGSEVSDVTECPNYGAVYGTRRGNDAGDGSGGGGRGGGGSGGGGGGGGGDANDTNNKGVGVTLADPDVRTKPLEPIARAIDSCVSQGHADFRGISYVLEFKKITLADGTNTRAMGAADAENGITYLDIEEIAGPGWEALGWKRRSAMTSAHELLHHRHPDWNENRVLRKETDYRDLANRCASAN